MESILAYLKVHILIVRHERLKIFEDISIISLLAGSGNRAVLQLLFAGAEGTGI